MFAIYPEVDKESVQDHAVVFTDDFDMAKFLQREFSERYGARHQAYLVMPSWPDAQLVHDLNGCPRSIWFSCRCPESAHHTSFAVRQILRETLTQETPTPDRSRA